MCFLADAPCSWWLATAPQPWTPWCVYISMVLPRPRGQLSHEAVRGQQSLHPRNSPAGYRSSPAGSPLSGCGRAAINPLLFVPPSVHHYLIATALGTIATAVPVNRKYFPLERNLLLVFELVLWCWSCALGHYGSRELLFDHYDLHQMTG